CPSLPPEIWIRILSYHTDLTHLWTTCRLVSPSFLAYTEQVFAEYILRDTVIEFQLEKYNLGGRSKRPCIPCTFSRFAPAKLKRTSSKAPATPTPSSTSSSSASASASASTKKIVHFKDARPKRQVVGTAKASHNDFSKILSQWTFQVDASKPELPNYTIRIRHLVNDTALPDLAFSAADREIRFDWLRMFALFFREQARLASRIRAWHADTSALLERNRDKVARGEALRAHELPQSLSAATVEFRKQIRRERLRECYAGDAEMLWAIDSLKYFESQGGGARKEAFSLLPEIPGAGVGERWFGSTQVVQGLYLDEWSCMHRID
ncbi:hypothetical protein BS50DRAFT_465474, partial [Corynespora cassiicola Philippines]